ncbi:glutathione S-transferase family protein [Pseudoduganella sp. OTU4001]|uniref:glutathione S-transferase family protein n=1 Tax=Pseudoduganella sp. OTU4001 TaxID=3043854 RepID=UPI00313BC593
MKPVIFYGVPSGCSLASVIASEWLGQPYHLVRIEMMDKWPAQFAQVNPRMKTPAMLTASGDSLTESLAILQHIGQRGVAQGLGFEPGTPNADRLASMLSYLVTDLFAAFAPLWKLYDAGIDDPTVKSVLRKYGEDAVRVEYAYLDSLLADRAWLLGGDKPTVADAYLFAIGRWAEYHTVFKLEDSYPNVARYMRKLAADPAIRFAQEIEKNGAARGNGSFQGHVEISQLDMSKASFTSTLAAA